MKDTFNPASGGKLDDVVKELKNSNADVLVNMLPVGSENASKLYARASLEANVAFINAIPVS